MPPTVQAPGSKKGNRMEGAQGLGLRLVGSWTRVVITAAVVLVLWLAFAWLAVTGRLAELPYLNIPLLHPYPPPGYVQNPFNPWDKHNLINAAQAGQVKADLLQDGQLELQALAQGDPNLAGQADTGRAKDALLTLIAKNNAAGVIERQQTKLDSAVVGRSPDPSDSSIQWVVEEKGTATISRHSTANDTLVSSQAVRFDAKFWMLKVGNHYLIADVLINSQPITGG